MSYEMSEKEAVTEVFRWQYQNTNSFFNKLLDVIHKADVSNRAKLMKAFPNLVAAHTLWMDSPTPGKFFESYGCIEAVEAEFECGKCGHKVVILREEEK